jgi:nitrile hydratase beta subunit
VDGIHDMGGMAGFGSVDVAAVESGHDGWEARAQVVALVSGGMSRFGIEQIPPDKYLNSTYAERWLICAETKLVGKGQVDAAGLARWKARFESNQDLLPPRTEDAEGLAQLQELVLTTPLMQQVHNPQFEVGDRVRVRRMRPEPHNRCPRFVRGAIGEVERVPGSDPLPDVPNSSDKVEPVYTVRFESVDLWGDQTDAGEPPFDLLIDLWQSYLEAA